MADTTVARFPLKQTMAALGLFFAAQFGLRIVTPFLLFMVHDFFPELPATSIGYRTGYLVSSYYLGQIASSVMWGRLADKFGRRPVVYVSLAGVMVSNLLFGFSISYVWAILSRTLFGFLNGTAVIVKAILSEILSEGHKARGFSLLGVVVSLAEITAPVAGGFLTCPAARFPDLDNSFFVKFAYCIPSLVTAIITVLVFVGVSQFLKETRYTKTNCEDYQFNTVEENVSTSFMIEETKPPEEKTKSQQNITNKENNFWKSILNSKVIIVLIMYGWLSVMVQMFEQCVPLLLVLSPERGGLMFSSSDLGIILIIKAVVVLLFQAFCYPYVTQKLGVLRAFQLCLFIGGLFSSVVPFVSGLSNMEPTSYQKPTSLGCFHNTTCRDNSSQEFILENIHLNKTEPLETNPYDSVGQCDFGYESKGESQSISTVIWVIITFVVSVVALCNISISISIVILVQNSAEYTTLGTINGIAHTLASIGRCIGPSVGANVFAWSQDNGFGWPLDYHFMFHIMSFNCFGVLLLSSCLNYKTSNNAVTRKPSGPLVDSNSLIQRVTAV